MSLGHKIHTSLLHSLVTKALICNTECQHCTYAHFRSRLRSLYHLWFGQTPSLRADSLLFCAPEVRFTFYPVRTAFTHIGGDSICLISPQEQSGSREILGAHLLSTPVEEKRCTVFVDSTTPQICTTYVLLLIFIFHEPCVWYSWHYLPTGNDVHSDNWIFRKIPWVRIRGWAERNAAMCITLYQALLFLLGSPSPQRAWGLERCPYFRG